MSATTADRTYFRFAKAWHGLASTTGPAYPVTLRTLCGVRINESWVEQADRVPANGHLCGSCARVIAARTDIE